MPPRMRLARGLHRVHVVGRSGAAPLVSPFRCAAPHHGRLQDHGACRMCTVRRLWHLRWHGRAEDKFEPAQLELAVYGRLHGHIIQQATGRAAMLVKRCACRLPYSRADGGRTHGMCLGVLTEVNLARTPAGTMSTVTFDLPGTGELRRRACARNPGHAPAKRLRLLQATRAQRVGRCMEARRRRPHPARRPQLPRRPLHGRLSFQRPLRRRRNRRTRRPLPRRPLHSRLSFQRHVRRRRYRREPHPLRQCHPEPPPPSP